MTWTRHFAVLAVVFALGNSSSALGESFCDELVTTESGILRGMAESETATCVWKGIPYAAPPVGELRWRPPRAHPGWEGERDATRFGPVCIQDRTPARLEIGSGVEFSEDCLYLNIWRPAKSGPFPVMVWIHGGGYATGSGITPIYRGDRLAEFGEVVVVTINYRLNVFGFLAHPKFKEEDADKGVGGYGILDQVAALRWVRDNIKAFGGDPAKVTIFGESAGGWAVCTLMATPLAKGLFHRAIIESQGCEASVSLEQGYDQAAAISQALGCERDDVDCLRAAPADKLFKTTRETIEGRWNLLPNHDGILLTDTPLAMIKSGNYNQVPLLAGSNRDEADALATIMSSLVGKRPADYEKLRLKSLPLTETEASELVTLYPLSDYDGKVKAAYGRILSDALVSCPTYSGMAAAARNQNRVYYYRFDFDEMRYGNRIGALHAMELPFVFNSFDRPPISQLYKKGNLEGARMLSEIMQGYWVNFARSGNPNGPGLPDWPEFSSDRPSRQILDTQIQTERSDYDQKCGFWEKYNRNHGISVRRL